MKIRCGKCIRPDFSGVSHVQGRDEDHLLHKAGVGDGDDSSALQALKGASQQASVRHRRTKSNQTTYALLLPSTQYIYVH
jgi:hypothetical protein